MGLGQVKLKERYVIEKELGRGGLGIVYLASDTHLFSRPVVIKTMLEPQNRLNDSWFREKFEKEIEALARITDRGVVGVSDNGLMPDGTPFFVMQYIEGVNLRRVMHGQGMELKRAAHIIRQLSYALSAAHEKNVIHRDLKPENAMLQTSKSGEEIVILIDFGIATVKDLQANQFSQPTRVAGTIPYMAPEQLRGEPIPASDIWSLGVIAYEIITGCLPFSTDNMLVLAEQQRAGVSVLPRQLRPELPLAAQAVILKALTYGPAGRYQQAQQMGEEFMRAILQADARSLLPLKPSAQKPERFPSISGGLRQRCVELFEDFDEFRNPSTLRAFFHVEGLKQFARCVERADSLNFDQFISCMLRSGQSYLQPALLDLLEKLALCYAEDMRGQDCKQLAEEIRDAIMQTLESGKKG